MNRRKSRSTFLPARLALGCQTPNLPDPDVDAWSPEFEAPALLETDRVRLEPLAPRHAELDFAALMGSREHLQGTLHWGDWPRADFTLDENREDLVRHRDEFERHEAYAYTALTPDRSRCIGCIYLEPAVEGDRRDSRLAFWVIEKELANDLDRHLIDAVLGWIEEYFPLDSVALATHTDDERGILILADAGLEERASTSPSHRVFVWRRTQRRLPPSE